MAGELDIDGMLRRHTAKWFRNWEHYWELEPFGELRADYRAASICALIANVNRGKDQKAFTIKDFLLPFGEEEEEQRPGRNTREQQIAMIKAIAAAHGAEMMKES